MVNELSSMECTKVLDETAQLRKQLTNKLEICNQKNKYTTTSNKTRFFNFSITHQLSHLCTRKFNSQNGRQLLALASRLQAC